MKLIALTIKLIAYGSAAMSAFCIGYAAVAGAGHVYFTSALYAFLSYACFKSLSDDRRREGQEQKKRAQRYE